MADKQVAEIVRQAEEKCPSLGSDYFQFLRESGVTLKEFARFEWWRTVRFAVKWSMMTLIFCTVMVLFTWWVTGH